VAVLPISRCNVSAAASWQRGDYGGRALLVMLDCYWWGI